MPTKILRQLVVLLMSFTLRGGAADADWPVYLGDASSSQFSALDQINRLNVHQLEVAWTYHCGDLPSGDRSQIQCNPLIVDGVLYGTSPAQQLFAVQASTGAELWRFDPYGEGRGPRGMGVSRGLAYWSDAQEARLLYGAEYYLYAINADTGRPVMSFGNDGRVDLRQGLGREAGGGALGVTTPGVLYENLLIMGMRVGEGPGPAAPGPIRAYDVRTGKLVWRFNTIPHPGEFGHDTWPPDAYRTVGGANVWTGMALDRERGLVFCPTGAAAFDFWGGNRIGQNLFANCLIALNARTGERVWHFQFVRHDLWDRDLPSPPNLLTVTHDGQSIDAVAQVTKSGHVFVFNRETGEPLFPIEDVVVPRSDLQGESAWPTQPLPSRPAPFTRQVFTVDQINDLFPASHRSFLDRFVLLQPHAPFAPPSTRGTIIFPGFDGGAEWGGAAVDPEGVLYVNANEMPWVLTMVEMQPGQGGATTVDALYRMLCAPCHGLNFQGNAAQSVPTLVGVGERLDQTAVAEQIRTGKGAMPSFAFLSEAQREALARYVLAGIRDDPPRADAPIATTRLGGIPYTHTGYNRWLDTNGYPAVKPPWGTLNAIDLNTGEYLWRTTLGEERELTAQGIPPTGTENYGGPVVTAGGVIFIAATRDECIRAFDKATGEELWKAPLPAGGYATPATYSVEGRQFVVIACGGGKMRTKSGDAYVAFALPSASE